MLDKFSFDRIIQVVQMNKINTTLCLEKYKMFPKRKAKMNILLYKMILMHVVRPTLKIDILKMEQALHFGYREDDKVF
jgi:hypothetical protein